jgi:hypothetical protein
MDCVGAPTAGKRITGELKSLRLLVLENPCPLFEGEIVSNEGEIRNAHDATKHDRYKLLAIAREITNGHAVIGCLLYPTDLSEPITVKHDQTRREARFGNVQTCKSVWACPVCADRITRFRAAELLRGMETWTKGGNRLAMATYTLSHRAGESCKQVLDRLQAAYKRFKGDRAYKSRRAGWAIRGSVRVLELTFGANGWHWHIHEIYFLQGKREGRNAEMAAALRSHWQHVVKQVGGAAVAKGFELKNETRAAFDYVSKFGSSTNAKGWNLAREVARSPAKIRSNSEGLHPFQILASARRVQATGDRLAWNEYVQATKGTRQLVYSPKLRSELGLGEVDDATITDLANDAVLPVLARITTRGWYYLNRPQLGIFSEFKQVADTGDVELLEAWLDSHDIDTVPHGY